MIAAAGSQGEITSSPGTAVYQVMPSHLETWLSGYRKAEEGLPVAEYSEQKFRKYLECCILTP